MLARTCSWLPILLLVVAPLAGQNAPKPEAEHRHLAQSIGTWDAAIETVGTDGRLHQSKGVSVRKPGPGGFWVLDDFEGEMNGVPFTGHGAIGYDPQKKAYVQSWVSLSPMLVVLTGSFDRTGKVLTMTGDGPSLGGAPLPMKNVTTWTSADAMTLEVFVVLPGGQEVRTMTIRFTRRADEVGARK